VKILATPARAGLAERIAGTVRNAPVVQETFEHPYYDGLRFMINIRGLEGEDLFLSDGGAFDWLRKLTSNRRLTFVASGMGSQRLSYLLRA
jgi:hypothetical protein